MMRLPHFSKHRIFFFLLIFLVAVLFQATQAQSVKAERIDAFIKTMMEKGNVPGLSVAVVDRDTVLFSKGYGITGNGEQVTANTPFGIASLSKAFTATLVMQLVEAGKVDLDARIVKYIPSFAIDDPRGSEITVRQLLNQTSGLSDLGFPEMAFKEQPQSLEEAMARMRAARLVSGPGTQFHYHNPNYQVLAALVESVTKEKYSGYLDEHICKPLGMLNTRDFPFTDLMYSGKENFRNGHIFFLGKSVEIKEPNWFVDGAGGIVSTSTDMAKWLSLQLNNGSYQSTRLLSRVNNNIMRTSVNEKLSGYGMGWFLSRDSSLYHSGILWTYSSQAMIYTKEGYGIVVLFNGGMNAFMDYHSFVQGIHDILMLREPEVPSVPYWVYSVIIGIIFLLLVTWCIRSLYHTRLWLGHYRSRARWKSITRLAIRVFPFVVLIFIPWIIAQVGDRVLSWKRIFLLFPDGVIGLGVIAVLNLLIVLFRLGMLIKGRRL